MTKSILAITAVAMTLFAGQAFAECNGGTCDPTKPPKPTLLADCDGGTCDPTKPPKPTLLADCDGGTCDPTKPPKPTIG